MKSHPLLHTLRNEANSLVKIHHAGRGNVSSFLLREISFNYLKSLKLHKRAIQKFPFRNANVQTGI